MEARAPWAGAAGFRQRYLCTRGRDLDGTPSGILGSVAGPRRDVVVLLALMGVD